MARTNKVIHFVIAGFVAATATAAAQISNYNSPIGSPGYTVPVPVETATAFAGFRTYNGLVTRGTDLALTYDHVEQINIGTTRAGRTIWGYRLTDANNVADDGTSEAGMLIDGGIHAREWCSPEILTRLLEDFSTLYGTDPVITYLVDNNRVVLIPVLNVDGFLQTQRTPSQYIGSADGRMRRKNMLNVDEVLSTTSDANFGVDLNRNCAVGWGGASGSPSSETYRGSSAFSEPETQALRDTINLFQASNQLRFYSDIHGAIPATYIIRSGVTAADTLAVTLGSRMIQTFRARNGISSSYGEIGIFPGDYIGATDEYFGITYTIPSYTIEYPTPNYREGGSGPTFVLPNDEVFQTWDENRYALLLAFYAQSGPPVVERVTVWRDVNTDNQMQSTEIYSNGHWEATSPGSISRTFVQDFTQTVYTGQSYRVLIQFNKPMRMDNAGSPGNWPGQSVTLAPTSSIALNTPGGPQVVNLTAIGNGWKNTAASGETPGFAKYMYDTWEGTMNLTSVPGPLPLQTPGLNVTVQDFYGHALDARPQTTADWSSGWIRYENAGGTGSAGGTDSTNLIQFGPFNAVEDWQRLE